MIQADEGSYLANAAAIAGYVNDMGSSYNAGYSLLLAPAFLDGVQPAIIWNRVKMINAALLGLAAYIAWILSKQWRRDLGFFYRAIIVSAVAAYPMWVVLAGYSFSQIAFVPFSILIPVLIFEAADGSNVSWGLVGLVAGFMYWIHPTGVVAIIAATLTLVYLALVQRRLPSLVFYLMAVSLMIVGYKFGFSEWLHSRMTIGGPLNAHYPSVFKLLLNLTTADGFKRVMSVLGGHLFYISIGSLGLVVAGIVVLYEKFLTRGESDFQYSGHKFSTGISGIYVCLSIVGILIMSSIFMARPIRLDHWMYGRYVEGFIAPALVAALLFSTKRHLFIGVVVAAFGAMLLVSGLDDYMHTAPFNVSSFWQEFYFRSWGVWGWFVSGVFVIWLFIIFPQSLGAIFAILFFSFCSALQLNYHARDSEAASLRWDSAKYVRENFPPGSCVGFDHSGINSYNRHIFWFDFSFQLYNYALQRMSAAEWARRCDGPLFSYAKNLDEVGIDAHIEKISLHGGPFLWVKGKASTKNIYPVSVGERNVALTNILGDGWYGIENKHVWSSARAVLRLPTPDDCYEAACNAIIEFNIFGASPSRAVSLNFLAHGGGGGRSFEYSSGGPLKVVLPLSINESKIDYVIEVKNAISPKELQGSADSRVLGVALISIDYKKMDGIGN